MHQLTNKIGEGNLSNSLVDHKLHGFKDDHSLLGNSSYFILDLIQFLPFTYFHKCISFLHIFRFLNCDFTAQIIIDLGTYVVY